MRTRFVAAIAAAAVLGLCVTACGGSPKIVRGAQDPNIDREAMSTGLDKNDIQRMLHENLNNLREAPVMVQWRTTPEQETVAIFPFINGTSEHIEPQLDAILGEAETWLVESGTVTVVSRERQNQLIAEIEGTRNPVFNQDKVAQYGQQLGVKFYMTGKVAGSDERNGDERRIQYFFFMQVIEVATGAIKWQHKSYATKAIMH